MKRAVEFYSEGFKLCGDIYVPTIFQLVKNALVFCCATAIRELRIYTYLTMLKS